MNTRTSKTKKAHSDHETIKKALDTANTVYDIVPSGIKGLAILGFGIFMVAKAFDILNKE